MDSAAIAGRSGKAVWLIQLVRWETEDFTLRLASRGGCDWGSERFLSRDQVYGSLGELPDFDDGIDDRNTRANLTFIPESDAAIAALCDGKHQKTNVRVWDAALDGETGQLAGAPDLLFEGFADFARLITGSDSHEVVLECGTEEELLTEPNEDRRLSHTFHQSVWPGELGLIHVTGLGRKIYWRAQQPRGSVSGGGGYDGGGGVVDGAV